MNKYEKPDAIFVKDFEFSNGLPTGKTTVYALGHHRITNELIIICK